MKRTMWAAAAVLTALNATAGMIVSPVDYQVVQRDAQDMGTIPVEVAQVPDGSTVRVRATVGADAKRGTATGWTELKRVGEVYTGTLKASAGGWYTLEAEVRGPKAETLTVKRVGVGEIFVTYGQSNSACFGKGRNVSSSPLSVSLNPRTMRWQPCRDPQPMLVQGGAGGGGSCWPAAGDFLAERLGVPIGFLSCGHGGASVNALAPSLKPNGVSLYDRRLKPSLAKLPKHGFRAVLYHQGETDAMNRMRGARYESQLKRLIAQSRKDAGWEVPWIVANAAALWPASAVCEEEVIQAQRRVIAGDPLVFCGPYTDAMEHNDGRRGVPTQYRGDNTHFNARGARLHGLWWSRDICKYLFGLPADEVVLTVNADTIAVGRPVTYRAEVRTASGKTVKVPVEAVPQIPYDWTVTADTVTLNALPDAKTANVRFFVKARLPGAATDPEETGNRLTGYAVSEPVILKIVR